MTAYNRKRNDVEPPFTDLLRNPDGSIPDLTGSAVRWIMRAAGSGTPKVNAAATVSDMLSAAVQYSPTAADVDTAGDYDAEWQVTYPSGRVQSFPENGYHRVVITADLDTPATLTDVVTVAEAKRHLGQRADSGTDDAELAGYIAAATVVLENLIGGPIRARTVTELHDGGRESLWLYQTPVVAATSVTEYAADGTPTVLTATTTTVRPAYGYLLDTAMGRLLRYASGYPVRFGTGQRNVEVVYTAGHTTVPATLRLAALEMVRDNWQPSQLGQYGTAGPLGGIEGEPVSEGWFVSRTVHQLIAPHRRTVNIA